MFSNLKLNTGPQIIIQAEFAKPRSVSWFHQLNFYFCLSPPYAQVVFCKDIIFKIFKINVKIFNLLVFIVPYNVLLYLPDNVLLYLELLSSQTEIKCVKKGTF